MLLSSKNLEDSPLPRSKWWWSSSKSLLLFDDDDVRDVDDARSTLPSASSISPRKRKDLPKVPKWKTNSRSRTRRPSVSTAAAVVAAAVAAVESVAEA